MAAWPKRRRRVVGLAPPTDKRVRCSCQIAGIGRSSFSSISDRSALPITIASMMSGANNARRRTLLSAGTSTSRARRLPFVLLHQFLVPPVGTLRETGPLHPYDAEALAGGRLHDHPALQVGHHLGA
jgi:hypothetical protein